MFDSICVRRQNTLFPAAIDAGLLAELLLFYGRVRVVADRGLLTDLAMKCGAAELVELVSSERLQLAYTPNGLGILTHNTGSPAEIHRASVFSVPAAMDLQHALPAALQEATGKPGLGRRLASKLEPHVEQFLFDEAVTDAAMGDFTQPDYMARAIHALLAQLAPGYDAPDPLRFETERRDDYLQVSTNLDFTAINASHHRIFPPDVSTLTPASILSQVLHALGELNLGAAYTAELATDPAAESVIREKCAILLAGRERREGTIDAFQQLTVNNGRAIREVVNSGERSFRDVIELLDSADRFRGWLHAQEPTADLVSEYVQRVADKTWIERLPAKVARWTVATGAGFALGGIGLEGLIIGAGLDALDTFYSSASLRGGARTSLSMMNSGGSSTCRRVLRPRGSELGPASSGRPSESADKGVIYTVESSLPLFAQSATRTARRLRARRPGSCTARSGRPCPP